ncbi:hypothetical protein AWJ20_1771 [Sugiyamaella lignohabitans]|uniref:Zn(2)-C6 fungal-type domain-containing protein n=1 Tax=Sugiyamaella lignohabitans TaxID=796027 RepID=A0A167DZQ6_9ASCO|nr:uncharacterized protein AWJ20_1771 [Sugiyamaella lignohabitans]ANB13478.1 hypothetical protein AWJ20_1771 [Sugiyamaella lignohabitans]
MSPITSSGLSRRKACLTCSTKKRRCDMLYPSCTRCSTTNTTCIYTANTSNPIVQQLINGQESNEKCKKDRNILITPGISYGDIPTSGTATVTDNNGISGRSGSPSNNQTSYLLKIMNSTPPTSPSLPSFVDAMFDIPMELEGSAQNVVLSEPAQPVVVSDDMLRTPSVYPDQRTSVPVPSPSQQQQQQQQQQQEKDLEDISITTPPDSVGHVSPADFDSSALTQVKRLRFFNLNYRTVQGMPYSEEASDLFVRRIHQYPKLFLKKLKVSFIHPSLYPRGYPPVLLTALAVCSLYINRPDVRVTAGDSASRPVVAADFNRSINQLVESMLLPMPVMAALPIHDKLALAQALILTQCIRLYSGDIRFATQAEKIVLPLTALFDDLVAHVHDLYSTQQEPFYWNQWIFVHSITRTCFLGSFIQGLYYFLREQPEYNLVAPFLPMSLSRAKWRASSEAEWSKALSTDSQPYEKTLGETFVVFDTIEGKNLHELCYEAILMFCFCFGVDRLQSELQIDFDEYLTNSDY